MLRAKLPNGFTPSAPADLPQRLFSEISEVIDERTQAAVQVVPATLTYGCDGLPRLNPLDGTGCDPDPSGQLVLGARLNGTMTLLTKSITPQLAGSSASLGRKEKIVVGLPPRAPGTFYAGTDEDTTGVLGVYRSTDGGETWSGRPTVPGDGGRVYSLIHAPGGTLYAAAGTAGVYRSTDGGHTWLQSSVGLGGADVRSLAYSTHGSMILAGTTGSGLFRTLNGGLTWTRCTVMGHGLDATAQIFSVAYLSNGIALVSTDQQFVTVGDDVVGFGGLYRLSGTAWVQLTFPGTSPVVGIQAWGVDRASGGFSAGAWAALTNIGDGYTPFYRTTDSGITFLPVYPIFGDDSTRSIMAVAADQASPRAAISAALSSVCYAAGNSSIAFSSGVIKTADGGATWSLCLELLNATALAIDSHDHTHVLAGAQPAGPSAGGIFATHDSGATWDDVSTGLDADHGGLTVNVLVVG